MSSTDEAPENLSLNEVLPISAAIKNHPREGFQNNHTVFGKILRGELPAQIVYEDELILAFKDISPASSLHCLIIPKDFIPHYGHLRLEHKQLLLRMKSVANRIILANQEILGERPENIISSIGFHKKPLIQVYHLHLHVISPMPANSLTKRLLFPINYGRFYKPIDAVIDALK